MDFESQLAELFAQRLSLADEAIVRYEDTLSSAEGSAIFPRELSHSSQE